VIAPFVLFLVPSLLQQQTVVELVESWPSGTMLDHADLRDASALWVAAFDGATTSIELANFYANVRHGGTVASKLERAGAKPDGAFIVLAGRSRWRP
jgi:hypothetical protein